MDEYFIGAGALLTAGPAASIAGATLHAQTEEGLAGQVRAAVVDFESAQLGELSRLLIAAGGWSAARFRIEVIEPLLARRECTLADVFATLGHAVKAEEVHLFARWTPDQRTARHPGRAGNSGRCPPPRGNRPSLAGFGSARLPMAVGRSRRLARIQAPHRVRPHDAA